MAGARRSLASGVSDRILNDIVSHRYAEHTSLPSETELAKQHSVSRLTVREAVKSLAAKGVLRVEQGRGTLVNPMEQWSVLDPVLLIARYSQDDDLLALPRQLIEARRLVEVGVTELAASRCSREDCFVLEELLMNMRLASSRGDVTRFVAADIGFHQRIMDAAGNVFLASLFDPLSQILERTRTQTSAHQPVRDHAIKHHQAILDALRESDPTASAQAMRAHIDQTESDLNTYVVEVGHSIASMRAGDQ